MSSACLSAAIGLLLALAAAGSPARQGAPTPGSRWVVVQTDGARVTFSAPPERRGARLVGRLLAGGALVSIPEARVDRDATRRANEEGAPAPAPAPAPPPVPRPFETPPLGDRVRLLASGAEARAHIEGALKGTPAPPRTPSADEAVSVPDPTDRLGRGESYWRERAADRRAALEEAAAERAVADAMLEAAERDFLGASEAERTTFVVNVLAARERAERARQQHRRAAERWEALSEEARKAGAFPGWLR